MEKSLKHGADLEWLAGGGELAEYIRSRDWNATPLGPIEKWPQSLRTTVSLCLSSNFPINIIWGPEAIQIYNAGYRVVCGQAHPRAIGEPYNVTWASAWPVIGEPFERARRGETSFLENQRMFLHRNGYLEETFFTFSLSPIRDESGGVAGLFHPVTETTATMLSERRTSALRDIANKASNTESVEAASRLIVTTLSEYVRDLPFVLLYFPDVENRFRLTHSTGVPKNYQGTLGRVPPELEAILKLTLKNLEPTLVNNVRELLGEIPCGEYPEATEKAYVVPLKAAGHEHSLGFLVAGLSTRLPVDRSYESFFEVLGASVSAAINNARAYEEEKKRSEALAEIDRAKTAFFSNVSHEFRTPLTLMLGPLEGLLEKTASLSPQAMNSELQIVYRNALRLLKLVNTILDFTRIEANRAQALFKKTDLCSLTSDIASTFRSAIERAGMKFTVEAEPLEESVYIDHDSWEKIILNLLSNAFKYTFDGEIKVQVTRDGPVAELAVSDTGTGIPSDELPKLFDRFHRVQGARGRTHEGTGIGLALVKELVTLHGGTISAESMEGKGSRFRVRIPFGVAHLPLGRVSDEPASEAWIRENSKQRAQSYLHEASQWLSSAPAPAAVGANLPSKRCRIILADDNSDMRNYVQSLLIPYFDVETVANGFEALRASREKAPDLIVSDIMMPELDGFGLVRELRKDANLKLVPVILLSARAGNEEKLRGLEQGVDDYLVKPFSARELIARVQTQLRLSQAREQVIRQSEGLRLRDEFIQVASHELKTPVTSLQLQLQILRRRLLKDNGKQLLAEKYLEELDGSLKQTTVLTSLINDLLEVSRIQSGKLSLQFSESDLSSLVNEVLDRYGELLNHSSCRVDARIEDGVVGTFDKSRIEQVLVNLIGNVCKYAPGSETQISLQKRQGVAVLTVKDTGPGIDEAFLPDIFDRFSRGVSPKNVSGMGLGLYISKSIIEGHSGSIEVQSGNGGTTFTITFPLSGLAHDQSPLGPQLRPVPSSEQMNVH